MSHSHGSRVQEGVRGGPEDDRKHTQEQVLEQGRFINV